MVRIRHVAICTGQPWEAESEVQRLLGLAVVQRDPFDPAIRIRNGVFALQDTFLEITAPGAPDAPAQRFLDRRGEGGYMVCLQVDDLDAARRRAESMGVRVALTIDGHRSGAQTISSLHLHPSDTGGTLFSFELPVPPESWAYGGLAWRDYRRLHIVQNIVGVQLTSSEPDRLIGRLAQLLDISNTNGRSVALDRCQIAVAAAANVGDPDRLAAIEFSATDRSRVGEQHTVAGTVLKFV